MDPQQIDNEQQAIDNDNPNVAQQQEDVTTNRAAFTTRYQFAQPHLPIGTGGYGKVYRAVDTVGTINVAIKVVRTSDPYPLQSFKRELAILRIINNAERDDRNNTVPFLNFHHNEQNPEQYLVLEKLDRTLASEVQQISDNRRPRFTLDEIRTLGAQIANGLAFLHNLNIIHADLKPRNIMFPNENSRDQLRIIDFGQSFEGGNVIDHHIQKVEYRAMEVYLGLQQYTNAIDIWSFGCILVFMYTAKHLFRTSTDDMERSVVHQIVRTLGMPPDEMLNVRTQACYRYFKQMSNGQWKRKIGVCERIFEPRSRNIGQFLELNGQQVQSNESQAYESFVGLIEKMIKYDVNTRINAAGIIVHHFITGQPAPQQ